MVMHFGITFMNLPFYAWQMFKFMSYKLVARALLIR